jgi:hypothetical protein
LSITGFFEDRKRRFFAYKACDYDKHPGDDVIKLLRAQSDAAFQIAERNLRKKVDMGGHPWLKVFQSRKAADLHGFVLKSDGHVIHECKLAFVDSQRYFCPFPTSAPPYSADPFELCMARLASTFVGTYDWFGSVYAPLFLPERDSGAAPQ